MLSEPNSARLLAVPGVEIMCYAAVRPEVYWSAPASSCEYESRIIGRFPTTVTRPPRSAAEIAVIELTPGIQVV
jgi:hypothetical protein